MKREPCLTFCLAAARSALPLLLLAATGAAFADDPNPYFVGISAGVTHDSNIFRVPDGAQGDTFYSAGLLAGIDQPFGRQHFTANGNVKYNRFSQLTFLDNTSYGLTAQLDWAALDKLSGTVSAALNQNLASYVTNSGQFLTKKNVETDQQYVVNAQYGLISLLSLDGTLTHQQIRYSAVEYNGYETDQDTLRLGVKYRPSGLLTLGAYLQTAHGRYPAVHGPDGGIQTYTRNDVVLAATWIATGQSTIDGRINFGRQNYSHSSATGFSGTTGQLRWTYTPTGKLAFTTFVIRDTGFGSSFVNLNTAGTGTAIGDNSRLSTTLGIDAKYAATGKISLNAGGRYIHRSLTNTLTLNGTPQVGTAEGTDNIQSEYLGVTYTPLRSLQIGCNFSHETRTVSSGTPVFLSYPYSDNTVGCSAQLTLQ